MQNPIVDNAQFEATTDQLVKILSWVRERIEHAGFAKKDALHFELALEEAIVNIIQYAYPQKKGLIFIESFLYPQKRLEFLIIDEGAPFDPLSAPIKQSKISEEAAEGGLGILFLRTYCDTLTYDRAQERNVLKLTKSLT